MSTSDTGIQHCKRRHRKGVGLQNKSERHAAVLQVVASGAAHGRSGIFALQRLTPPSLQRCLTDIGIHVSKVLSSPQQSCLLDSELQIKNTDIT